MIEHEPWKGPHYETGINGERIAIVGHSHYRDCEDTNSFTLDVMSDVISGRCSYSFFNHIATYFDARHIGGIWNRVLFFNYLPDCVGSDEERYKFGRPEQIERGHERFLRLLAEYRPQKVFVFSKKIWPKRPPTREDSAAGEITDGGFSWGTYQAGRQIVMDFNLRHPERAPKDLMRKAVQRILSMPLITA